MLHFHAQNITGVPFGVTCRVGFPSHREEFGFLISALSTVVSSAAGLTFTVLVASFERGCGCPHASRGTTGMDALDSCCRSVFTETGSMLATILVSANVTLSSVFGSELLLHDWCRELVAGDTSR